MNQAVSELCLLGRLRWDARSLACEAVVGQVGVGTVGEGR